MKEIIKMLDEKLKYKNDLSTENWTILVFPVNIYNLYTFAEKICVKNRIQRTKFGQFPNVL